MNALAYGLNAAIEGKPLDEVAFNHPWTARAFALVIAGSRAKHFTLTDFQQALIIRIKDSEEQEVPIVSEEDYYTCWLEALTDLFHSTTPMTVKALAEMQERVCVRLEDLEHSHSHSHAHRHSHAHSQHDNVQSLAAWKPVFSEGGVCK